MSKDKGICDVDHRVLKSAPVRSVCRHCGADWCSGQRGALDFIQWAQGSTAGVLGLRALDHPLRYLFSTIASDYLAAHHLLLEDRTVTF